jgi:hypothetical protein
LRSTAAFPVRNPVLRNGVLAVQDIDELGVAAPGDAFYSFRGDVRADDGVLPAGLFLIGGEILQVAANDYPPTLWKLHLRFELWRIDTNVTP